MTRTDSLVVGTLVVLLALIAGLVSVPSLFPAAATVATPQPSAEPGRSRGRTAKASSAGPVSVSPLTRPDPGRPRPRRARLLRARPQRPGRHARAGPRRALDGRRDRRGLDVPAPRRRPLARRRAGHRRGRRVHHPRPPGPRLHGARGAGSWNEVSVADRRARARSCSRSTTPLGGFLQAATQPIAPAHLLADVPVDRARRPTRSAASRSGPGRSPSPASTTTRAELDPGQRRSCQADDAGDASRRRVATDSLATPGPAGRPTRPVPYLAGHASSASSTTPTQLAAAYRAGGLDAASGLSPAMTRDLGDANRQPVAALPGLDADRRPAQPAARSPGVREPGRADGPARGDRPARAASTMRSPWPPAPATGPIPPASCAVRPGRRSAGRRTTRPPPKAALQEGRLDQGGRRLAPAQGEGAARRSSCSARTRRRTRRPSRPPQAVAARLDEPSG